MTKRKIGTIIGSLCLCKESLIKALILYCIIGGIIVGWHSALPERIHFFNTKQLECLNYLLFAGAFFNFIMDVLIRWMSRLLSHSFSDDEQ